MLLFLERLSLHVRLRFVGALALRPISRSGGCGACAPSLVVSVDLRLERVPLARRQRRLLARVRSSLGELHDRVLLRLVESVVQPQ